MFSARSIASPALRTAFYSRPARVAFGHRAQFLPASVAAMSTVTEALTKDHRELEEYYNEVINSSDPDHQQRYGNQFTWELARHSVGEELIIYPAFEKYLGEKGKEIAESDRKQHHQIKEDLKVFQNMKSTDQNYVPKLKELYAKLEQHIKEEERDEIPALEKRLAEDHTTSSVSETLAKSFGRTKHFIPTRSHPSAGENPVFESVVGLMAAPMDKLGDMLRKFPDSTKQ